MDPDQTAPLGPHCLQKRLLKSQTDDKADDNCCDWQFKAKLEADGRLFFIILQGNKAFLLFYLGSFKEILVSWKIEFRLKAGKKNKH